MNMTGYTEKWQWGVPVAMCPFNNDVENVINASDK
jgi:hypothetical protein